MTALAMGATHAMPSVLRLRRLGIDTYQEPVVYMSSDCSVCRSEGWAAQSRLRVSHDERSIVATLNVVTSGILSSDEVSLSDAAWAMLRAEDGNAVTLSHPEPLESLGYVRAKVYGHRLGGDAMRGIIGDVAAGRYSALELAAFVTACAGTRLNRDETTELTRAMVDVGERLEWRTAPIVDKHCVGGLPGNRTTMILVPIVAACGLTIPKTSSRAITSPAGTADAMETVAPVSLDVAGMRRVVDREGGCIVWGGAVSLSPADDVIIRVERPLDLDSEGQLVASILSKKAAAGSTYVVIDLPVGPTAKVRDAAAAEKLESLLVEVGRAVGLTVRVVRTDGSQPVGRGIGPALEARDVLAVLRNEPEAPVDLRERALLLAGTALELAGRASAGQGRAMATRVLDDGSAWRKFQSICEAQGGMREPPRASLTRSVEASNGGRVMQIDNRRLARIAKLAGAPDSPVAGLELHLGLGHDLLPGAPLFTIHAQTPGELDYALAYARAHSDVISIAASA